MNDPGVAKFPSSIGLRRLLAACLASSARRKPARNAHLQAHLGIQEVQFSQMQPPTLERTWTAALSVDASRCATNSGRYFGIIFSRMKENAPQVDFVEHFVWKPGSMEVSVIFWPDEAVDGLLAQ